MNIEQVVREVVEKIMKEQTGKNSNASSITNPTESGTLIYSREKVVEVDNPVNAKVIADAQKITPARIGIGRAGTRMKTKSYLDFRLDHAAAQDAVRKEASEEFLAELGLPQLKTVSKSLDEYLMNLDSGRYLSEESADWLKKNGDKGKQVQIIVSDGLSTTGMEENIPDLLSSLQQGLSLKGISMGQPIYVNRSRVWVQDHVASIVDCDLVISLIGERPGLATSKSLSAYFIYKPGAESVESDRTVISNIHQGGMPPVEAGAYLSDIIEDMLKRKASGVKYTKMVNDSKK
ncbi:ethanolamine ammonia-lyase subunit EutC [Sporosarcina sp. CAU 1771]